MSIVIIPEFGAFRKGESRALRAANLALEKANAPAFNKTTVDVDGEKATVSANGTSIFVELSGIEDPFVFDMLVDKND